MWTRKDESRQLEFKVNGKLCRSFSTTCSSIKRGAWFRRNWCRKNKHTISSVSSAIWARFRSTKHATSTRIWTWSINAHSAEMFDVLARATKKYNQCCWQNLPALKIWMRTPQTDKNLSRQNLSFDSVETIPVLFASAERPLVRACQIEIFVLKPLLG